MSSKDTRLKFSLQQKTLYRAYASTDVVDKSLCKMVGEAIKGNSEETFSCQMKIPDDAINTVQNCEIIFVDYYVKVLLENMNIVVLTCLIEFASQNVIIYNTK